MLHTISLAPLLLLASLTAAQSSGGAAHVPPVAGEVAKSLETVYWYDLGSERREPDLLSLRGNVVLVHTWGYYCGPCVKKGVPYVADLMKANKDLGLRALSITVAVGDGKPDDHFVKVGREMGMEHPLGIADGFGEMTPYLNMNKSKALTWCFVIGREGGVRWAGDPSSEDEEFLEAVQEALAEEAAPPLPQEMPEPLAKAAKLYVEGDLGRARDEAAKVATKYARKSANPETQAVVECGNGIVQAVDAHRSDLESRLEKAIEAGDAEAFVTDRRLYLARFEKAGAKKWMKERDKRVAQDPELLSAVELWSTWDELRLERPALFPVRVDESAKRYAKKLARYAEAGNEERPGLAQARKWLAAFDQGS